MIPAGVFARLDGDIPRTPPTGESPMTDLYARLGIDLDQLGCVMLDCESPTFLHDLVPPAFWYRDPAKPDEYGPELESHVTLLFGLLSNANTIRAEVDEVLDGWTPPTYFEASKHRPFEVFGGDSSPYDCIVLRPNYASDYAEAHGRLSRLPHVNTFPHYQAHVTVGYVVKGAAKYLLPDLERAMGERRTPLQLAHTGLNYGRPAQIDLASPRSAADADPVPVEGCGPARAGGGKP